MILHAILGLSNTIYNKALLGVPRGGVCCLTHSLTREEKGHHCGATFLVFLFRLMMYCGEGRTSKPPGKLLYTCPWLRTTGLALSSPVFTIGTRPLVTSSPRKGSSCSLPVLDARNPCPWLALPCGVLHPCHHPWREAFRSTYRGLYILVTMPRKVKYL